MKTTIVTDDFNVTSSYDFDRPLTWYFLDRHATIGSLQPLRVATVTVMRDTPETIDFPSWLDTKLGERDWEVSDLARHAGISASIIHRWRKSYRPNVVNCRAIAKAFGLPLLEVMTVAGIITANEARAEVALPPSINTVPTVDLTRELHRRAEHAETAQPSKPDYADTLQFMQNIVEELRFNRAPVEGHHAEKRYRPVQTDDQ